MSPEIGVGRIIIPIDIATEMVKDFMYRSFKNTRDAEVMLKERYQRKKIALSGEARIARGENLIVALNFDQMQVMAAVGGFEDYQVDNRIFYVNVLNNATGDSAIARLTSHSEVVAPEQIVISNGLASVIHSTEGTQLTIAFDRQDLSPLDLDR